MGHIYKRGNIFWIKYHKNGKPFYESSKSKKESDAKRLLKKREGEISQGKIPGVYFEPFHFRPYYRHYEGKICEGLEL